MARLPILCLDFDGVLHSYTSGWKGAEVVADPPVPGAMEFLKEATGEFIVAIYSTRSNQEGGIEAMKAWLDAAAREEYGMEPFWLDLIQWPQEKPAAMVTIDDRAIQFTGTWPSFADLNDFRPWNKRSQPSEGA